LNAATSQHIDTPAPRAYTPFVGHSCDFLNVEHDTSTYRLVVTEEAGSRSARARLLAWRPVTVQSSTGKFCAWTMAEISPVIDVNRLEAYGLARQEVAGTTIDRCARAVVRAMLKQTRFQAWFRDVCPAYWSVIRSQVET
jgi:hypothetical protein